MKHVCQTVLPNVYILVHSWTADQEFKCSLFLISRYYSHCMLCPKPVTPFGHESQQCFHLTGSKETQVLSTCISPGHTVSDFSLHFYLYYMQDFMQSSINPSYSRRAPSPRQWRASPWYLSTGKVAEMCLIHPVAFHSLLMATAATRFSCPGKSQTHHLPLLSPKASELS